jgi:O-antigen/teichoic acid export membrane protein
MTASEPSPNRGLLANAGSLFAGRLAIALMGWAGTVLIVRTLTEEQWGQFAFVFGLLGMLTIFTDMGIGRVAISGVLDERENQAEFAGTYVVLRAMLGLVGYAVAVAFVALSDYPADVVRAVVIAGLTVLVSTPSNAHQVAFQAHMRLQVVAVSGVIGQAAQLAVTAAIAVRGGTLLWFLIPPIVAEIVMVIYKLPKARELIPFHYVMRPDIWARLLREAVPLSIGGAFLTITYRIDTVMLSKLDTFEAVGAYGVAYKFADLARFAATAVTMPILTMLTNAWPSDVDAFRTALRQGAVYLTFIGGGLIVGFSPFAAEIIGLLFSDTYRGAGTAAVILIVATGIVYSTGLSFNALVAAGRNRWYPVITLSGLLVNVGLNVVLIPRYSIEGAAIATLITEVIIASLLWGLLLRVPGLRPIGLGFMVRFAISMAIGLALAWAVGVVLPWVIAAIVAGVGYLGAVHLTKAPGPAGLRSILEDLR